MDLSVIVPTFREADNLPFLVEAVSSTLTAAGLSFEILVVDDASDDGTVEVCAALATQMPVRLLVRREERGLASAVVHGMRSARGTFLVVMDADLSHPPEAIPSLLAPLRAGQADFVLGSRYVPGGSTEEGWGLYRWLNSRVATLFAWPLARLHDPLAGFFALPRRLFEAAAPLDPIGYKIGLELLVKCACRRVVEVPIHFRNRLHGTSKLTLREQINYLRHLLRLYHFVLTNPRTSRGRKKRSDHPPSTHARLASPGLLPPRLSRPARRTRWLPPTSSLPSPAPAAPCTEFVS